VGQQCRVLYVEVIVGTQVGTTIWIQEALYPHHKINPNHELHFRFIQLRSLSNSKTPRLPKFYSNKSGGLTKNIMLIWLTWRAQFRHLL